MLVRVLDDQPLVVCTGENRLDELRATADLLGMSLGFGKTFVHHRVLGARIVMCQTQHFHLTQIGQFDAVLRRSVAEASGTRFIRDFRVLTVLYKQMRPVNVTYEIRRKTGGTLVIREEHENTPSRPLFETVRYGVLRMQRPVHPHNETFADRKPLVALERELLPGGLSPLEDVRLMKLVPTDRMNDQHLRADHPQIVGKKPMPQRSEVNRKKRRLEQIPHHLLRPNAVFVGAPHVDARGVNERMTSQRETHRMVVMRMRHEHIQIPDLATQQRIGVRNQARTTINRQTVTLRDAIRTHLDAGRVATIPNFVRTGDRHRPSSTPHSYFHRTSCKARLTNLLLA